MEGGRDNWDKSVLWDIVVFKDFLVREFILSLKNIINMFVVFYSIN